MYNPIPDNYMPAVQHVLFLRRNNLNLPEDVVANTLFRVHPHLKPQEITDLLERFKNNQIH